MTETTLVRATCNGCGESQEAHVDEGHDMFTLLVAHGKRFDYPPGFKGAMEGPFSFRRPLKMHLCAACMKKQPALQHLEHDIPEKVTAGELWHAEVPAQFRQYPPAAPPAACLVRVVDVSFDEVANTTVYLVENGSAHPQGPFQGDDRKRTMRLRRSQLNHRVLPCGACDSKSGIVEHEWFCARYVPEDEEVG